MASRELREVVHVFNLSIQEAEPGGSLWVWDQPGLLKLVLGQSEREERRRGLLLRTKLPTSPGSVFIMRQLLWEPQKRDVFGQWGSFFFSVRVYNMIIATQTSKCNLAYTFLLKKKKWCYTTTKEKKSIKIFIGSLKQKKSLALIRKTNQTNLECETNSNLYSF